MVRSHQALLLIAPLKEREVNNPKTLEYVLITKTKTVTHFQTQRAKLNTCLVCIITAQNQNKVTILGSHYGLDFCKFLWRIELIYATLYSTISIILDIYQSFGTDLRTLNKISQFVQLLTTIISAARNTDTTDILSLIKYREITLACESIFQLNKFHTEAQVWFITTKTAHSFVPGHLLQLRKFYTTNLLEQMASHFLEKVDNIILINKTHFTVNLCKLWLSVSTKVLITEALGYLEIAVEASNHQELLQSLRALWKSVELTWIHTRRNHKIAGSLWCTTNKNRCFNLHEVLCIEEVTNQDAHTMAQLQILAHSRTTQIKITILHSDIITTISIIFDSERRSLTLREHIEFLHQDFDVTSIHFRILALSFTYYTLYLNAEFTT